MKKMKVVRSRKRFNGEDGSLASIDREPLRDSSGRRVRSGMDTYTKRFDYNKSIKSPNEDEELEGSDVMSGSTEARQGKKFPETRIESGPKGHLDDDIKAPSEKDDNGIRQRPRPRPPGAIPIKNVDIDESDRRREERENAKKTQDVDESDRRREQISNLKPSSKPEKKPEEKPPGRTAAGKTAEQEEELIKKFKKKSDEVPSVEKIKKEQEGTSEGTSTSEKLKSGLSDTAEKVLGAMGATAGTAALGRQAYKMAKAPLGFTGEAKRMASNVGQSLRNAVSGRKPNPAGEGSAAAKQATKFEGSTKAEKAKETLKSKKFAEEVKESKRKRASAEVDSQGGAPEGTFRKGGKIGFASRRGDGAAIRGKTRGRIR